MNSLRTNKRSVAGTASGKVASPISRPALPALLAVVAMFASPASALELGELQIDSTLGQPLRASIAYALRPNETLSDLCIHLDKGSANGLQALTRAEITLDRSRIVLRSKMPINEAMLGMQLTVKCPATPHLTRSYVLMIGPPGRQLIEAPVQFATTATTIESDLYQIESTPIESARIRRRVTPVRNAAPLQIGNEYRVQSGDSLSEIASRIAERPIGLWPAVDALFTANPEAFVNGNRNRIKAGSVLTIPAMQNIATANVKEESRSVPLPLEGVVEKAHAAYDGIVPGVNLDVENEAADFATTDYADDTNVLGSGAAEEFESVSAVVPVGRLDTAIATISNERAPTSDVAVDPASAPPLDRQIDNRASASSWLAWFGGAGLALMLGLLMFGRKLRDLLLGDSATAVPSGQEVDDDITLEAPVISEVDHPFDTEEPNEPTIETTCDTGSNSVLDDSADLDIDLGAGTGFQGDSDLDVAQDFGFSPTGENETPVDLEINAEVAVEPEQLPTDIIPPHLGDPATILDSEVPPSDDDGSRVDLSMIVDATKHALGKSDATAKDLMAVQMSPISDGGDDNAYTLSKEIDYRVLEQDYEDEMTATQALNEEVAKAALELAERMDIDEVLDVTAEMHAADEPDDESHRSLYAEVAAELTAELPTDADAENDDFIDNLEITGISEQLTADFEADTESDTATIDTKKLAR